MIVTLLLILCWCIAMFVCDLFFANEKMVLSLWAKKIQPNQT